MKKIFLGLILILTVCLFTQAQTVLTYQGQTYNNTSTTSWLGVDVPRSVVTTFSFLNNSVTSVNTQGYMLQAGEEGINSNNNHLDGELIQGNKFNWNGNFAGLGTEMTITHGLFTGCNVNVNIKHNYLSRVPMGIIRKSASNMSNTTGGVSYNILKTFNVGGVVKGMSNVNWYNNTFYQDRPTYSGSDPTAGTWRGAIDVYTNTDVTPNSVSHGIKIKNNIFYTKYKTLSINVMDAESLIGFECDYNVYWCEEGDHTPVFIAGGSNKTWAEWRALGYDAHSVVMNPNFIDFVNFVPSARLNYGTDLGTSFNTGLATNATWTIGSTPTTQVQNGTWQVGARIYAPVVVAVPPTVTTTAISSITTTTAISGGNITSDGGATVTERGVCWDQSGGPALDNVHTHDGTGTGTFISNITGLSPNTTYYVRAYATNSAGTGYGNMVSFTTSQVYYLLLSKSALTVPATANSDGKFNIISNTTWNAESSQSWLTVAAELFYTSGGQSYKTVPYSGSAPDIGAFEFMQTYASGHDSAFITLTAEANAGPVRNATVTVTGTGVPPKTVAVTQEGAIQTVNTYYVSSSTGNDSNNGTSEATPWQTLTKINNFNFLPGDRILFKRGDTFRGYVLIDDNGTSGNPITFDAYGSGNKPKLWGSKDYSLSTQWTLSSGNIWATTTAVTTATDVANLIFNNEASCGVKRTTLGACTAQGNWYVNPTDKKVYLYSTSNPGSFYSHIEVGGAYIGSNIEEVVKVNSADYITIRNLDVRYSPNNGIIFMYGSQHGVVEYCDVSWIGGMWVPSDPTYRMGNGIGIWVDANDIVIRYNYVHDCYDAGISPQGGTSFNQTNIQMYYNKVVNCYYSYEAWAEGAGVTMNNVNFYNNTCVNANSWSINQRPDASNARHVMIWTLTGNVTNCNIKNNIFVTCANAAVRIDDNWTKMALNNNLYNVTTIGLTNNGTYTTLAQWQAGASQDANSLSGNPNFISSTDFHLQSTSIAINKGVSIAGLTQDLDGNSIIGLPDIGAYEFIGTPVQGVYYVSTSGNDATGNGTITNPWFTLNKAWTVVAPGDVVYMRGGTYQYANEQVLTGKNGTLTNPIRIEAYQNEKPIIRPTSTASLDQGIYIHDCEYIQMKGLEITGYVQPSPTRWGNGIYASDISHCVFENLNIHHGCFGMSLTNDDGITTDNLIYNCDFHHNSDPITSFPPPYNDLFPYGNADGLTIRIDGTLGLGTVNSVIGCRMYYNSDDGLDLWSNEGMIIIKDSWAFLNGYYDDTTTKGPGDGNGFKLGLSYIDNHNTVLRKVYNCIGYMNSGYAFVRNGAACNMEIYNNTAYSNGASGNGGGFFFGNDGGPLLDIPFYIKNNIAYSNVNNYSFWDNELLSNVDHNTWNLPVTVSNSDFVNLVSSELFGARQADGSLPNINFLHLATGSDLINVGVDVGIPHKGTNPDLGAFEYNEILSPFHQIIVSKGFRIKTGINNITTDIQ